MQEGLDIHNAGGMPERQNVSLIEDSEMQVPAEWNVGDLILGLYEVKYIHGGGGMGLVYRVHHRGWNVDLAVKSPRLEYFQTEKQKDNFTRECETWIDLGLHPNIVSCHYVRNFGGIPRVFAEYAEDGSLSDWIRFRKLYAGGAEDVLRRILDIGIQMAWGLQHAHEHGVIHQDIKPANILMNADGTAKVTDYGLAKARASTSEAQAAGLGRSILVSSGGLTPAYCSPEQAGRRSLTRRTDIWSWAVAVYEMYVSEVSWQYGPAVPESLEAYLQKRHRDPHIPRMPSGLALLLQQCLRFNPDERPHDFAIVSRAMMEIYRKELGSAIHRAVPERHELDADSINNRIVSLVDLNRVLNPLPTKATGARRMPDALSLIHDLRASNPDHLLGRINNALIHWRKLGQSIFGLNCQLDNIYSSPFMPDILKWQVSLEVEKCDFPRARQLLGQARRTSCPALMDEVYRRQEYVRSCLFHFFQNRAQIPKKWFRYVVPSEEESLCDCAYDCAMSNPQSGIVACHMDEGSIVVTDLSRDIVLCKIAPLTRFPKLALSENGKLLVCAFFGPKDNESQGLRSYTVSVYSTNDGSLVGTYAGKTEDSSIKAITIDDRCQCVSIWLERGYQYIELVHDMDNGELKPFRCDFRIESIIRGFRRVFINGDRTLLLAVSGSRCSLWRFPSAENHDGFNVIDIDLADFGLLDSHGQLRMQGFEPDKGFGFEVNDWNAHDLMRLLNTLPISKQAEYLLCQPQDTASYFATSNAKKQLLQSANVAEASATWGRVLDSLNIYCDLAGTYEEPIMYRRHKAAQAQGNIRVERVWHHDSCDQYWNPNVFGLCSEDNDSITVHRLRGIEVLRIPEAIHRIDNACWDSDCAESEVSTGIHHYKSRYALVYINDRMSFFGRPCAGRIALYDLNSTIPPLSAIWTSKYQSKQSVKEVLNKIACVGETVLAELESGVVEALDLQTGGRIGIFHFGGNPDFVKTVHCADGKAYVFVCSSMRGVVLDGSAKPCKEFRWSQPMSRHLETIVAVADNLSSVVCWYSSGRLAHVRLSDYQLTEVWRWFDENSNGAYYLPPASVVISPCGRAIAYAQGGRLNVFDVASREIVFRWILPLKNINGLSFDRSGRWLVLAHSENQFEVFQLFWNTSSNRM